ncbi:MAG TPA: tRNA epoxyqueuosine(34) reductase QueG [Verrucomicrobiae bacterium]|nr:tRNA epoxyqueuosine(34) reductase QueG [Verrucomicrobiae bacterium]
MGVPATLAAEIDRYARELGFDLVGITSAKPPPHVNQFRGWLQNGFHGEMGYLERHAAKRAEPRRVLADARSVVVVAMNYFTGDSPPPSFGHSVPAKQGEGMGEGRVARYAWGERDYHEVLGEKLKRLADHVCEFGGPGTRALSYVDTGPILERDLAQRAGVGFIGKHTNLISRRLGNWIFLGQVLTNLELESGQPELEYCGTCHRCIDACPTRAIVAPYQLDARLCISYLTIELKGAIPVELRPAIGDRIFGCDDCLEVCPWNRFAQRSPVREFQRRELPPLTEFLSWDDAQFNAFFRGTPIYRIKRRGFLRNVCVALGNVGDSSALPALERALDDHEPLVREHARWAIGQIRSRV